MYSATCDAVTYTASHAMPTCQAIPGLTAPTNPAVPIPARPTTHACPFQTRPTSRSTAFLNITTGLAITAPAKTTYLAVPSPDKPTCLALPSLADPTCLAASTQALPTSRASFTISPTGPVTPAPTKPIRHTSPTPARSRPDDPCRPASPCHPGSTRQPEPPQVIPRRLLHPRPVRPLQADMPSLFHPPAHPHHVCSIHPRLPMAFQQPPRSTSRVISALRRHAFPNPADPAPTTHAHPGQNTPTSPSRPVTTS